MACHKDTRLLSEKTIKVTDEIDTLMKFKIDPMRLHTLIHRSFQCQKYFWKNLFGNVFNFAVAFCISQHGSFQCRLQFWETIRSRKSSLVFLSLKTKEVGEQLGFHVLPKMSKSGVLNKLEH